MTPRSLDRHLATARALGAAACNGVLGVQRPYSDLHENLEEQACSVVRLVHPAAGLLHRSAPGLLIFRVGPLWFWLNEDSERPQLIVMPEPTGNIQMNPHGLKMGETGLTTRGINRLQLCVTATTSHGLAYNRTNMDDDAFAAHYGYSKTGVPSPSASAETRRQYMTGLFESYQLAPSSATTLSPAC